jgi:hypothetical protein
MSEREDWINLIHNEYDPRPNLGKADYSGFEWDDGTGRIADAIMADKVLALREAAARIEALEAQLRETLDDAHKARLSSIHHATDKATLRNHIEALEAALREIAGRSWHPANVRLGDIARAALASRQDK